MPREAWLRLVGMAGKSDSLIAALLLFTIALGGPTQAQTETVPSASTQPQALSPQPAEGKDVDRMPEPAPPIQKKANPGTTQSGNAFLRGGIGTSHLIDRAELERA